MKTPIRPFPLWGYAAVVALVVAAAYGADAGSGFIKEDAVWVMRSRFSSVSDVQRLFTDTGGFFRPVVALSFALDYAVFGANPLGYGWTNLLVAVAATAAVYRLAVALTLPRGAALFAASLWVLNFHGIGMAVLWLSGRTALLLVLFSTLAATAAARGRIAASCGWALVAMLCKEEAVLLPAILFAIAWGRGTRVKTFGAALAGTLLAYALLRSQSNAMTPLNAPPYYTFTFTAALIRKNLLEYADRTLTLACVAILLALVVTRRMPRLDPGDRRMVRLGAIWMAAAFGLTMFLPVRSSLYACFPSIGAALAAAAVVRPVWLAATLPQRRALSALAIVLPLAFVPIYRERNRRWTELGGISRGVVLEFSDLATTAPEPWLVVVVDERVTSSNVASAVGWALPDTVQLATGRRPRVWITPPPPESSNAEHVMPPASPSTVLVVRGTTVTRLGPGEWTPRPAAVFY